MQIKILKIFSNSRIIIIGICVFLDIAMLFFNKPIEESFQYNITNILYNLKHGCN